MPDGNPKDAWRPGAPTLVGAALFLFGLFGLTLSWWSMTFVAAGAFGPNLLRELGLLNDRDEFQLQTMRRAGHHAYLVGGIAAALLVGLLRGRSTAPDHLEEIATVLLALLGATYLFSSLVSYWGAIGAARRLLFGFGCTWFVFCILANVGSEWRGFLPLLLHPLLTLPFFLGAWLAPRAPRPVGLGLLVVAIAGTLFLRLFRHGDDRVLTDLVVFLLLAGPLIGCGVALLARGPASTD